MIKYKCINCENVFPVKKWFNYIYGKVITFGFGRFYCDDCWEKKKQEDGK